MNGEKYLAFKNNGKIGKGRYWTNAPVRQMRNAFFEVVNEYPRGYLGLLHYQTAGSDEWQKKEVNCNFTQPIYSKIKSNFIECTEQDFINSTKDGFDMAAKRKDEEKTKAASISYVGNKFIYSKHDEMMKLEKKNFYIRNQLINFHAGYGGIHMRSFVIEILSETTTLYKTKLHYLPTNEPTWKTMDKSFSKRKFESAFGSGIIVETTDDVVAKYMLISDEVPKKSRKKSKSPDEVYDSFDLKEKVIELSGKAFKVGTLLRTHDSYGEMGNHYSKYGVIKNITEKNVIIIEEALGSDRLKTKITKHEDFAYWFGRVYDFINIHQDLRRDAQFITDSLRDVEKDYENHFLIRNQGLREAYKKYNPDWMTDK
jgi:hypothetical protein